MTTAKKLPFKFLEYRCRKQQKFDPEKIIIKKAGKTINVFDWIQSGREDTEIYPTLEKYGCIDRMVMNTQGIYDDFTKFKDLRGIKEQQQAAEAMFYQLPLEVRQKFNNNISTFTKDGEAYLKKKLAEEKAAAATATTTTENTTTTNNSEA